MAAFDNETTDIIVPDPTFASQASAEATLVRLDTYNDAAFDQDVTRITDVDSEDATLNWIAHEYSQNDILNADASVVRLVNSSGHQRLYNFPAWTHWKTVNPNTTSPSDVWWHPSDPDLWYSMQFSNGGGLNAGVISYDTTDSTKTQAADAYTMSSGWSAGQISQVTGKGENALSSDGTLLAFAAGPGNTNTYIVVVNVVTGAHVGHIDVTSSVTATGEGPFNGVDVTSIKDVSISPDGNHVVISANGANEILIFDVPGGGSDLTFAHNPINNIGHKDIGQGVDGKQYLVGVESSSSNDIKRIDLAAGTFQSLRSGTYPGWGNNGGPHQGLYTNCNEMADNGYVYVMLYSTTNPVPGSSFGYWQMEIQRVQYDQTGNVERGVHNYANMNKTTESPFNYWMVPKLGVIPARNGQDGWIVWGSDMMTGADAEGSRTNYVDVYGFPHEVASGVSQGSSAFDASGSLTVVASKTGRGVASLASGSTLDSTGSSSQIAGPASTATFPGNMSKGGAF